MPCTRGLAWVTSPDALTNPFWMLTFLTRRAMSRHDSFDTKRRDQELNDIFLSLPQHLGFLATTGRVDGFTPVHAFVFVLMLRAL